MKAYARSRERQAGKRLRCWKWVTEGFKSLKIKESCVLDMEADKQEVNRSSLADREPWKQEGERFRVVDMEAGEQEVTRSRLTNGEILRQGGKVLCG